MRRRINFSRKSNSKSSSTFVGIFFMLFGALFGGLPGYGLYQEVRLDNDGLIADAVVMKQYVSTGNDSTTYKILYEFQTKNGKQITSDDDVQNGFWNSVNQGDKISVKYLPDDPTVNSVDEGNNIIYYFFSIFILIGSVMFLVGVYMLTSGISARFSGTKRREMKNDLQISGQHTTAKVTGLKRSRANLINHDITYKFRTYNSKEIVSTAKNVYIGEIPEMLVGDEIDVVYDPKNPKRNFWVGEFE